MGEEGLKIPPNCNIDHCFLTVSFSDNSATRKSDPIGDGISNATYSVDVTDDKAAAARLVLYF